MSIYSKSSIFGYKNRSELLSFREVSLPFEQMPECQDHLTGQQLYEALASNEVRDALEKYHISDSGYLDGIFEFRAMKKPLLSFERPSVIAFEGEIEDFQYGEPADTEYHYIKVELASPDQESMDELEQDLGLLEQGLTDYYSDISSGNLEPQEQMYNAD
jgi:hypothetical protein